MTIDNSYTNNIQGFVDVQTNQLSKISSAVEINKASDNVSDLNIAINLANQENALSQNLSNINSGIAMSNIAQNGLSSQSDILTNIKTETLKSMNGTLNEDDREAIANQVSKYIDQFNQIADSTQYNGTSLLKATGDEIKDDISILTDSSTINMSKVDTLSISDDLNSLVDAIKSGDSAILGDSLNMLDENIDKISNYRSDFASASNTLEADGRNTLSASVQMANAKSSKLDVDYAKEVSDFSKTNLMSQISMLVQSQANAVQSRTVPLLS